ncbi:hypothetical protein SUN_0764 [Sulfurovum sp. NBC37-1]|nr:hypothetical protein SUN_0764 [Sulfurovum sp. NBC37-1]
MALRLKSKCHDTLAHCPYNSENFDIKSLLAQRGEQIHDTYPYITFVKKLSNLIHIKVSVTATSSLSLLPYPCMSVLIAFEKNQK